MEALHGLAHIREGVFEGLERPLWLDSELGFDLGPELILADLLQSTVCVMQEQDLAGAEVLCDRQSDRITSSVMTPPAFRTT